MKKIFLITFIFNFFILNIYCQNLCINRKENKVCRDPNIILKLFFDKDIDFDNIKITKPIYDKEIGLCISQIYNKKTNKKELNLIYSLNAKYLFLGKIIDIKNKLDYIETKYSNKYNNNKIFNFKYLIKYNKNKNIDYVLFIDPLCPYCKEAVKNAIKYSDKYNFAVIVVPLSLKSLDYSYKIICSKNPIKNFLNSNFNSKCKAEELERAKEMIMFGLKIKDELNINSEPIYFFKDGSYLVGLQSINVIKKKINNN